MAAGNVFVADRRLTPLVLWTRHYPSPLAASTTAEAFAAESWAEFVGQLRVLATEAVDTARPGLLEQLRDAARLGVRTPRTLITTSPETSPWPRCVVKAVGRHYTETSQEGLAWFLPEIVERPAQRFLTATAPVVVQEYVKHHAEQRLYVVGDEVHAFDVAKTSPQAPWTAPETVRVRSVPPDPGACEAALRLAAHWGLAYGAFDFLLDGDGPVFLEMNADGDWHWFERRADTNPVTIAAIRLLHGLHDRAVGADAVHPLEITTFLAG
ncbi:RimK family alpha-L-glutamate ligase [Streptomyces hydrogenans]|uniref:ATP-grasp domain-containing protein n=1 Tax=Streptomyces hydrogenans TaxID=1873719 RepID=UPI00363CFE82